MGDVQAGRGGPVPAHLRDAHYAGSARLKHGAGYAYSHGDPTGVVTQQYAPDDLVGRDYFNPAGHGAERDLVERLRRLRARVRGAGD
jgi:putative ATPase